MVVNDIFTLSYTAIGFIPKWRGFFEETQIMATFYLMLFMFAYVRGLWFSWLFLLFSLYLFSKSVILASLVFILHIFIKNIINPKTIYYKMSFVVFSVFSSLFLLIFFLSKDAEQFSSIYEGGVENAASFHERIFHIIQTAEFISREPFSFLIWIRSKSLWSLGFI